MSTSLSGTVPSSLRMSSTTRQVHPILVVEDNPADARFVEILLMQNELVNCETINVESLQDGIEALNDNDFAAVLLDLTLPDSTELDTLENLLIAHPDANVIVMTGHSDQTMGVEAVMRGAQDFIVKGEIEPEKLGRAVRFSIERSNVKRRLRAAELEMEQSQQRYQDIFTQSRDAIFIISKEGRFVDLNEATCLHFGLGEAVLKNLANPHERLFSDWDEVTEFLNQLYKNRSVRDFEIKTRYRDNEMRYCLMSASLIENEEFRGYSAILRDVTERKQTEKLKKDRALAQKSAQMREQFIASVSHEMRTPMNAILGMSNILTDMELPGEAKNLVGSIKQSSEILLGIVNDILEISTIQNGKVVFESNAFDLRELLASMMNVMQYKAKEKDLYFEWNVDEAVPKTLVGDKLRLNQILYNLVGNAIKFTDTGYVKVLVQQMYAVGTDSVQLKFVVEDTGIGIPADKVDSVFETFTRIRQKNRLFEGTGLGLSIVKNLVEQQGGKVGATSTVGKGSEFFFDLIFDVGQADRTPADRPPVLADLDFDVNRAFRLLLVEDHKMNQLVASKTLERKFPNLSLTIAEDGQKAVDILATEDFDLILMDIQMPNMDGYEATEYLRAHGRPSVRDTYILAMTAHAHIAQDKTHLQHGMDDYVLKPFKPEELFYKIGKYLLKGKRTTT